MTIDDHTIVTLTYEVRDGGPSGTGRMLPGWERRIYGLSSGKGFAFTLAPDDAYGKTNDKHVLKMPLSLFRNEREQIEPGLLVKGQYVTLTDADGKAVNAKILEWDDKEVTLDANHALAGKTLFFSGAILNVRKATVDELIQKRYIDTGGVRRE